MSYAMAAAAVARVSEYFALIGVHLPRKEQRAHFASYAFGILGEGARKSVEPIAARACGDPLDTCQLHDRLLHFIRESPWDDRAVRREACKYVVDALQERERITTWVIDDTGFLKQGAHSPGVHRPSVARRVSPVRALQIALVILAVVVGLGTAVSPDAARLDDQL